MIAFLVQVLGVALATGLGVSGTWPLVVVAARRWPAGRRADALVVAGALPLVASVGLALALVVPTALDMSGLSPDHCFAHDHGLHLCGVHGAPHLPLLLLGAVLLPLIAGRAFMVLLRLRRASIDLRRLEALGVRRGGLVEVPGDAPLCHATGVLRPRVFLSSGLRAWLGAPAVEAALAHERAHLRRGDPAALAFLQVASAFCLPGSGLAESFRSAAEEAADAEAAAEVGELAVADALVRVARFTLGGPRPDAVAAMGFGSHPLQRRVALLLAGPVTPGKARGLALSGILAVSAILLGVVGAAPIHHFIEDILLARH